jgi:cell division transport system permease protein
MTSRARHPLRRPGTVLRVWLDHHGQSILASLGDLTRAPLASVMTVAVVAIALSLPATLYVATRNLATLAQGWQEVAGLSLFLKSELPDAKAQTLAERLRKRPDVATVQLVTPAEGLAELRDYGGMAGAVDLLADNPLPTVLALEPTPSVATDPANLIALRDALAALPEVDEVRLDTAWMQRLRALLDLGTQAALLLGVLLGLAVLLVVGNTLRLEVGKRREAIELMALVGATRAFVRRPFLYAGAWYGLLGAVVAVVLLTLTLALIQGPVEHLAALYGTEFPLAGLDLTGLAVLLLGGPLLGLMGAWLAVGRHLADCAPR